jgi:hypothetical protein
MEVDLRVVENCRSVRLVVKSGLAEEVAAGTLVLNSTDKFSVQGRSVVRKGTFSRNGQFT